MQTIKYIELFAGIGGFRLGFESACAELGVKAKCAFSSETDKYARQTYKANWNDEPCGDFGLVNYRRIPKHSVCLASTSCQPFSLAGKRKQAADPRNTIPYLLNYLAVAMPEILIHENVQSLYNSAEYETMNKVLFKLGYTVFDKVYNAVSVTPQNRKRLFTVAFKDFKTGFGFSWPELPELDLKMGDILEPSVPDKYTLKDKTWKYLQRRVGDYYMKKTKWISSIKMGEPDGTGATLTSTYGRNGGAAILIPPYLRKTVFFKNGFGYGIADPDGTGRTLTARYKKDGEEILIEQENKNPRMMTPRECARYMGFPDDFKIVVSDSQAYKQFGNAVVPPVVREIAKAVISVSRGAFG
ncbi:MAG: DNA (cytosine-5-)-methyltransferase [Deltaproteobacteria bacterium]|jgi:DNA (cytosine-5)-methyltransferase 1|nr:DNA (cytosine-5-)-methyltransferase [Deltaproteobacteria bacterium]